MAEVTPRRGAVSSHTHFRNCDVFAVAKKDGSAHAFRFAFWIVGRNGWLVMPN